MEMNAQLCVPAKIAYAYEAVYFLHCSENKLPIYGAINPDCVLSWDSTAFYSQHIAELHTILT
jgi:hypothetical protein